MKPLKKHLRTISSHVKKHHKKYLRWIWSWIVVISILGITGILSFVSHTFAASGNWAFARSDYYYPDINTTLTTDTSDGVLANDYSVPSWTLYAYVDTSVQHGSLTLSTDWSFTYIPETNYNGMDYFWYHAWNENYNSRTTQVNIQVGPPETAPVAGDDGYSTDMNTSLIVSDPNIMLNDSDAESDPMTAILNTEPFNGEVTLHSDWTFTYTPDTYFEWSDFFTYYLSDGKQTGNVATVRIGVNGIDDTDDPNTITIPDSDNPSTVETEFLSKSYSKGNWSLQSLSDINTLVGNKRINFSISNGQILVPLDMQSVSSTDKVEAIIPAGTIATKAGFGVNFSWTMNPPRMERTRLATEKWWLAGNVVSVVSFGNDNEWSIAFKDSWDNNVDVTIKIPAPWLHAWDLVHLFYSNDFGYNWYEHSQNPYANVVSIWWEPYVVTTTTHFTYFAIVWSTWSFVINNDDPSTTTSDVTLSIDLPVAANMRFSNDNSTRSNRERYDTSKVWTLSAGNGNKIVYAQFDIDGDEISDLGTNDEIIYNSATTCPVWSYCGDLTLEILSGQSYCEYGNSLSFWQINHSYAARSLSTGFLTTGGNTAWFCQDNQGLDSRILSIQASDVHNITTSNPVHTIPATEVLIKNPAAYISQGICTYWSWDSLDDRIDIAWPRAIFSKDGAFGEWCTIMTDNVELKINLTWSQALGMYSWTITINLPNF